MASTAIEVVLALAAKDAASTVIGNVGDKLHGLGKAGDVAKLALAGLTAGIGAAVFAGIEFARNAADEQVGVERLAQAIKATGTPAFKDLTSSAEKLIVKWERMSGFSDDELRPALANLVAITGDSNEAFERMPIALDFARGAGIDLATSTKLLSKVTDETVNVLGRYGIHVKAGADATEVLALVQQKFSGQAATFADTAVGKWQIFSQQIDNLKEDIGGALLPMFSEFATVATGAVDGIRTALASPELQGAIEAFKTGFGAAKDIVLEMLGVVTGVAPGAGAALTQAIGPEAARTIMGALALIRDIVRSVIGGDIPGVFNALGDRVPALLSTVSTFVADAVPKIGAQLLEWGKQFIDWIGPQIGPMLAELLGLLHQGLDWIDAHSEEIGRTLAAWGKQLGVWVRDYAIPALIENMPSIVEFLKDFAFTIPGKISGAFAGVGKGIAESIGEAVRDSWNGIAEAFRYMLTRAIQAIDFTVGPFHISGLSGITVSMPQLSFPALNLPSFGGGGIVPGAIGSPQLIVAHGGEEVRTRGEGGVIHTHVYLNGREIADAVGNTWTQDRRMQGLA